MKKIQTKKYLVVLAVVGLLIFLHLFKILSPAEKIFNNFFSGALSGLYSTGSTVRQTFNSQTSKTDLLNKISELEAKNKNLIVDQVRLKSLEEENKILRQNLKFQADSEYQYIAARVISRSDQLDLSAKSQYLIINKGFEDGIEKGQAVISIDESSNSGVVVGKIAQVKNNTAEIFLLTNPGCQLAVSLWGSDETEGIARGRLGLTVEVDYIPQTEELKIGDTVTTSGLEEKIPPNLIVGKITEIIKESNELWQQALIAPLVDLDDLTIVSVLLN
jgi:rod shape-determining protein MreC